MEDKEYVVTYSDESKVCSKTVTVKGVSSSDCCDKISITPISNKIPQEGIEGGEIVVATFTSDCPSSYISVECSGITRIEPNGNNIIVIDCDRNDGPETAYTVNLSFNGTYCSNKTFSVSQSGSLNVKIDTENTMLDGSKEEEVFIVYYWAEDSNYNIMSDGVVLTEVEVEASNKINYVYVGTGSTSDGKLFKSYKASENNVNAFKYAKFKAVLGEKETDILTITQSGKDMTILPEFDYLTFTLTWDDSDGTDLDTATYVIGSNLPISQGITLDDCPVGFGLYRSVGTYLQHGGDNQKSGDECALVNWKAICDHDYISEGITTLYCDIYANWFLKKGNGNCKITYKTYKGDGMALSNYTFYPTGNTVPVSEEVITGNVYSFSTENAYKKDKVKEYYSYVARLVYDIKSREGCLYTKMDTESGREFRSYVKIDDQLYESDGWGKFEVKTVIIDNNEHRGSIILKAYNTINGVEENLTLSVECKTLNCYGTEVVDNYFSYTLEGNILNYSFDANNTGSCRKVKIYIYGTGSSIRDITHTSHAEPYTYVITQTA